LPIAQFAYNATLQEGIKISLFKANYGYALRTLLLLKQVKKLSDIAKERAEKLITLHKELCKLVKIIQERIKLYYNKKKSEGPDFKKRDKVWLLHKNFKNWWLSKKLDYVKLELFKILAKILNFIYKLDLPVRMKIYLVQYIAIIEPAHGDIEPPLYKMETYRGQEEDKWDVQKVVNYKEIDD